MSVGKQAAAVFDIPAELEKLTFLAGRTPETPEEVADAAFANVGTYLGGEMFVGGFSGESAWERHPAGDELVHVLKGSTSLTILMEAGPEAFALRAGMVIVVPRGHWHRFESQDGVTVMTVTPQPTDHSAEDPRNIA